MGTSGRNTVVRGAGLTLALGAPGFAGRADQPWKDASHCPSPYGTLTGVMKSHTLCPAPGSSQGKQAFILPPRLRVQHLKSLSFPFCKVLLCVEGRQTCLSAPAQWKASQRYLSGSAELQGPSSHSQHVWALVKDRRLQTPGRRWGNVTEGPVCARPYTLTVSDSHALSHTKAWESG